MTPAVTANALIRLARVERSTSARIGYASEKNADTTRYMLNSVHEWSIDLHLNWRRCWPPHCRSPHHYYGSRGSRFGSFFVHGDKSFVKNVRDVEVIIRFAWRHFIEIGAALRNIECAFHSQRLKFFRERNRGRLKLELWQTQIDLLRFELCASRQNARSEL